ncbi:MAG: response regulator, partial [Candidatus Scalindua sp.]|nr:response regulator [Candidatus Scalindua sp.]
MVKPKLLIVDDESNTSILIRNMLEELGYNVAGLASSGKEAIQKTLQLQPNLVLMDIILGGEMDGVDAARQIHDSLDVPIVYLTGHADDDLLYRAKLTEPYGYIIKPFDESELRTTIEIALYRHKMEKLLKESGKHYKAVCELTSDYIFHINVSKDK